MKAKFFRFFCALALMALFVPAAHAVTTVLTTEGYNVYNYGPTSGSTAPESGAPTTTPPQISPPDQETKENKSAPPAVDLSQPPAKEDKN